MNVPRWSPAGYKPIDFTMGFILRTTTPQDGKVSLLIFGMKRAATDLTWSLQSVLEGVFATSRKIGLTGFTFPAYILPPFACQYLIGVLVQLEGTRFYRLALLPVLVWFAWRAAFIDMSGGDPKQAQANTVLITQMCAISMHSTVWAIAREPFRRRDSLKKQNKPDSESIYTAFWNAWDLMLNPRGIGWNWPRGLIVPKPAFETDSRIIFVLSSAARLAFHALAFDACVQTIRILSPNTFGSLDGGSLFDHTLPPLLELLRSVFVSLLAVLIAFFAIQWSYQFLAILCIILFQQLPSQWPPLFDSPWLSTSLSELWGRRWHQMMRDMLLTLGGQPFNYLFGRLGGLLGAFLISGMFHVIELHSLGRGGNSVAVLGFWIMNGVGVVLERVWKATTGRPVGGVLGWMWTFGWLALWGVPAVNEWAKTGRFGGLSLPGEFEPSLALVAFVRRCLIGS
ncbi:membrane bound O-acyl transferase family-domain-containing protein [Lanmaoa asiatica]|nr:membrane bound O-acyl transferase family-domain-containing protein [Lanmaoa asiatica]